MAEKAETSRWEMEKLFEVPKVYPAPELNVNEVKAIFYEGVDYGGKPTRVFAYYGVPEVPKGEQVPAMVLVHGGGGSAYVAWVELWVSRGYAAIAMDTCGCISSGGHEGHIRHEFGGPPGWGGLEQIDEPLEDQWTYHAVADVILANSLIGSFPEVDADKVGLTGISWGGYLSCIVGGLDTRFKFVAPVYGCGFLGDNSVWLDDFKAMGEGKSKRWLKLWDPSNYLGRATMPYLWVTGSTDFAFPMDSLQKSYRLPKTERTVCVRVGMPHGHGGPGETPEEIHVMAEAYLKNGTPLVRVTGSGFDGDTVWVRFAGERAVVKVMLCFTRDTGQWSERKWVMIPAEIEEGKRAEVRLPEGVNVYYFNLEDAGGRVVSSEHVVVD